MDVIMGGLLGIPHYSKIEFLMLGSASVGAFLSWNSDFKLYTLMGLVLSTTYMVICTFYAQFAKQLEALPAFLTMGSLTFGLVFWRYLRFGLDEDQEMTFKVFAGVNLGLCFLAVFVMLCRRKKMEPTVDRFVRI